MYSQLLLCCIAAFFAHQLPAVNAAAGYHYDPPASVLHNRAVSETGHYFSALPTLKPLPPVPALPPLPTGRSHSQSLVQVHPSVGYPSYQRPTAPTYQQQQRPAVTYGSPPNQATPTKSIAAQYRPPSVTQPIYVPPSAGGSYAYQPPLPSYVPVGQPPSAPAVSQAQRIPFGQQGNVNYPGSDRDFYVSNGRQLKQYDVYEEIDNDIEPDTHPFLSPFFDDFRARVGASGTGATASDNTQISASIVQQQQQQQRVQQQQGRSQNGGTANAVALGSGGLGFVRLPNGQVSLGSGSLAYISGQQRSQFVNEARTRMGAPSPDALHFGHGPLGGLSNRFRFK